MEKKELREKVFAIYKKVFKTYKDPSALELASLFNILGQALHCSDAEQELGKEVYMLVKRNTKKERNGMKVELSSILREIGFNEE